MENNSVITIEGSSELIVQFFECSLINILYQRGVYYSDNFEVAEKYGMTTMVTTNQELIDYIKKIIQQLEIWLKSNSICKWVIVIRLLDTGEVVERWHFDIVVNDIKTTTDNTIERAEEIQKAAVRQIQGILRQITASVSYLPDFKEECTFNVLVYGNKGIEIPKGWGDSHAHLIEGGGQHLRLKSLSTSIHQVEPFVAYKMDETL